VGTVIGGIAGAVIGSTAGQAATEAAVGYIGGEIVKANAVCAACTKKLRARKSGQ